MEFDTEDQVLFFYNMPNMQWNLTLSMAGGGGFFGLPFQILSRNFKRVQIQLQNFLTLPKYEKQNFLIFYNCNIIIAVISYPVNTTFWIFSCILVGFVSNQILDLRVNWCIANILKISQNLEFNLISESFKNICKNSVCSQI